MKIRDNIKENEFRAGDTVKVLSVPSMPMPLVKDTIGSRVIIDSISPVLIHTTVYFYYKNNLAYYMDLE